MARSDGGDLLLVGFTMLGDKSLGTPGTHQPVPSDEMSLILARFDAAGNRLWGTYYDGPGFDRPGGVAFGPAGDVFFVGRTSSADGIATPGALQVAYSDGLDGFLVRLNPNGERVWGTYIGGAGDDTLWGVAVDAAGNVIVCGPSPTRSSTRGWRRGRSRRCRAGPR
jgi:hypothetical protein